MTTRGRSELLALVLAGAVAVAAGALPSADRAAPRVISSALACPLTLAEEHKASLAFEEMMPVLMHPRCFNCHGGVNERVSADEGGHLGGRADPADCKDCHRGVRNLLRGRLNDWTTPPSDFFFKGKSSLELCNQFKRIELNPEKFVGHMTNENGGVQFTEAAYQGDRNLNEFGRGISKEATNREMVPEPPPIPHAELIAHAREWATTVGNAGWKVPDCGCRLSGQAWVGRVSMVFTSRDEGFGTLTERIESNVRFELDSSYILNAPGDSTLYWKTTSGTLDWSVTAAGGECTTSAAGTAPINLGADQNPWGLLRIHPDRDGALAYSIGIGPWPDAYTPRYVFRCKGNPPVQLPGIMYSMGVWWAAGNSTIAADGKTMRGTYTMPNPMGETRWVWELGLVR